MSQLINQIKAKTLFTPSNPKRVAILASVLAVLVLIQCALEFFVY